MAEMLQRAVRNSVPIVLMSEPGDPSKPTACGPHGVGAAHSHTHGHFGELETRFVDDMQSEEVDSSSGFNESHGGLEGDMEEELAHYEAVLGALAFYEHASRLQFQRLYRHFMIIPESHQRLFQPQSSTLSDYIHPLDRIRKLHDASTVNARFLETVLAKSDNFLAPIVHAPPYEIITRQSQPSIPSKNPLSGFNADKVHSTLCQLAREWSSDGAEERLLTFSPLLNALQTYLPITEETRYTCTFY